jgi:uncharacterized protein (TIGR00290 family)
MSNQSTKKKAMVSWTGGKDCALSLFMARRSGFEISRLVTFIPAGSNFRAHPLDVIEKQAEALNLSWIKVIIKKPYPQSYELSLKKIKLMHDIDCLITGDIDFIDNFPTNYMEDRCKVVGLNIFNPLWQKSREEIWELLLENNFEVIFSFAKKNLLNAEWIGESITKENFMKFKKNIHANGGDLCGENGEFHSIVVNSPDFQRRLILKSSRITSCEINYLKIEEVSF